MCGLFHRKALQEERLFQRAEELLVRARFFDGLQIELCAGPDDELRLSAVADCGGEAHEIAAVPKWPPCMDIAREEQERIRAIEEVGRVRTHGVFDLDKLLP